RSDRGERLVEIGDQIVRILDPDRDADQIVADPERGLRRGRDRQMGHRGRRARQRLGAAEADREMGDPQRIEEGEALPLATLQIEREGRAGAGAMTPVDVRLPGVAAVLEKAEIADALY